jgi:hypothetical protein
VAIVLFVAAVCARYWRTVLLMIMISLLIFTVLGLIAGLHDMQHLVRLRRAADRGPSGSR